MSPGPIFSSLLRLYRTDAVGSRISAHQMVETLDVVEDIDLGPADGTTRTFRAVRSAFNQAALADARSGSTMRNSRGVRRRAPRHHRHQGSTDRQNEWRWTQSAANPSQSEFPAIQGNLQGISVISASCPTTKTHWNPRRACVSGLPHSEHD